MKNPAKLLLIICGILLVAVIAVVAYRPVGTVAATPTEVDSLLPRIVFDRVPQTMATATVVQALDGGDRRWRDKYLPLLKEELSRYPAGFHHAQGLFEVVLVGSILVEGQDRGALPDAAGNRLYFNPHTGDYNSTYQRHCIHHEYFHFLIDRQHGSPYYFDKEWKHIDPTAVYGSGGAASRASSVTWLNHPRPGFVNGYSMSAPEEDMAEVFACLMTQDERPTLLKFAEGDDVLRRKIEFIRAKYLPTGGTGSR